MPLIGQPEEPPCRILAIAVFGGTPGPFASGLPDRCFRTVIRAQLFAARECRFQIDRVPGPSCAFTAKPKTDSIDGSMLRRAALAIAVISFSSFASAGELCVVCAKPDATYRCTLDQSTGFGNFRFGEEIQVRVCTKVLAKKGSHERCTLVKNANAACDGPPKTITFTDYQQVLASDGSSTYEPGLVALIGNKINKTWICITSIFKDC